MRILIDGSALLLPGGGVKSYLYYWLLHLNRIAEDRDRIRVFPYLDHHLGRFDHEQSNYGGLATAMRLALVLAANRPVVGPWRCCARAPIYFTNPTRMCYIRRETANSPRRFTT